MKARALIMDGHFGCQLWQRAVLQALGIETKILSLRRSDHVLQIPTHDNSVSAREEKILRNVKRLWRRGGGRRCWSGTHGVLLHWLCNTKDADDLFGGHDILLGSYPPNVGRLLLDLARRYKTKVVLNLANRCTLGNTSARKLKSYARVLKELHESLEHVLAVMGEYDYQHVQQYIGVAPLKLYVSCHHLPMRRHRPACDTVLVGLASSFPHFRGPTPFWGSMEEMNAMYGTWCAKNGRRKEVRFDMIRNLYPNYRGPLDLAGHPAVVILPHSAYSISMAELYEMNVPFFVPSASLLIKHQMPREIMEHRPPPPLFLDSPHRSFHEDERAMKNWLRFCYFYQVENAVVWDSPDDLFRKLTECDLAGISDKMYLENQARRRESLNRWAEVLA